jgi:chitinase
LQKLKAKKPSLKIILRISDDNGRIFSKLSKQPDTIASFIENTLEYIETHSFDGVEIDWKWPCGQYGGPEDRDNFGYLLKVTI